MRFLEKTFSAEQKVSLLQLFLIFVKIGAILLGGGYVILPIIEDEFVRKRKFLEQEEVTDYFLLSQSLPGIIAANMSMFIGYKLKGKFGAIAAMLGVISVPFLCIVILASILGELINNKYLAGVLYGAGLAVIVLIICAAEEIWRKTDKTPFFYVILLTSLTALLIFKLTPVQTILIFVFCGVLYKALSERMKG